MIGTFSIVVAEKLSIILYQFIIVLKIKMVSNKMQRQVFLLLNEQWKLPVARGEFTDTVCIIVEDKN